MNGASFILSQVRLSCTCSSLIQLKSFTVPTCFINSDFENLQFLNCLLHNHRPISTRTYSALQPHRCLINVQFILHSIPNVMVYYLVQFKSKCKSTIIICFSFNYNLGSVLLQNCCHRCLVKP